MHPSTIKGCLKLTRTTKMRIAVSSLVAGAGGALFGALVAGISVYFLMGNSSGDRELEDLTLPQSVTDQDAVTDVAQLNPVDVASVRAPHAQAQSIQDLASLNSDFHRSMSIYLRITNTNQDTLETYIRQSMEIPSKKQRSLALSILFSRYAALDPQLALDQFLLLDGLTIDEEYDLMEVIFDEWISSDLDGAVVAIAALSEEDKSLATEAVMFLSDDFGTQERMELARRIGPNDTWIEFRINRIRRDSYKDDPRKAYYDRLQDTSYSHERTRDLSEIVEYWYESEGVAVLTEIYDSLKGLEEKVPVIHDLIWGIDDFKNEKPIAILQVVSQFPNEFVARDATLTALRHWAHSDPQAAFEASLEFDSRLVSDSDHASLLFTWAHRDAEGLFEEALTFPRQFQGIAFAKALEQISRESPYLAIRLARKLDTRALRTSARNAIVDGWQSDDAQSAFEWLMNNELDVNTSNDESLWRRTFARFLNQDSVAARMFVDQYEGEFKELLVDATVEHLFDTDLESAMSYAESLDTEISDSTLRQIAHSLAQSDPFTALNYGETLEQHRQKVFYRSVLSSWSFLDFDSLHANIHRVPKTHQTYAAKQLLKQNENNHYLSDQALKELKSMAD